VSSDQKVWIPRTRRFLYPDVILVCGAPLFYEGEADVVLNPTLIVEVLSPSTEAYDRGEKFGHYRSIESLREYVLVAPTSIQVESYLRQESGFWRYAALETSASSVPISSLSIEIPISEIYRGLPSLSA
jgi:Uma2 family endonuclease